MLEQHHAMWILPKLPTAPRATQLHKSDMMLLNFLCVSVSGSRYRCLITNMYRCLITNMILKGSGQRIITVHLPGPFCQIRFCFAALEIDVSTILLSFRFQLRCWTGRLQVACGCSSFLTQLFKLEKRFQPLALALAICLSICSQLR